MVHLPNPQSALEQQEVDMGEVGSRCREGKNESEKGTRAGVKSPGRGQKSTVPGKMGCRGTASKAFWKGNSDTHSRDPEEQQGEGWRSLSYTETGPQGQTPGPPESRWDDTGKLRPGFLH